MTVSINSESKMSVPGRQATLGEKRRFVVKFLNIEPSQSGRIYTYMDHGNEIYIHAVHLSVYEEQLNRACWRMFAFLSCCLLILLMDLESPFFGRTCVICCLMYFGLLSTKRGVASEYRRCEGHRTLYYRHVRDAATAKYGADRMGFKKMIMRIEEVAPVLKEVLEFELIEAVDIAVPWRLPEMRETPSDAVEEDRGVGLNAARND